MADETKGAETASGKGGWVRVILFASLALNLLFLGALVGSGIDRARRPDRADIRELGFGPVTAALSQADRAALRRAFLAEAAHRGEDRKAWREDTMRLADALRSEPFDVAAAAEVTAALTHRIAARLDLGTRLLLARIGDMSAAERQGFADRLEAALDRPHRGTREPGN